ncbi:MAG: c-type cytochrome, partial [Gammaproteobacteria bacterium]|nr:c-type cytochrome [Gammaproteobacteria bacterium]
MAFSGQDCIKLAAWPKQVGIGRGSGVVALWLLAAASLGEPLAELDASQPEKGATSASMHSGLAQLLENPPLGLPLSEPPRPLAQASIDLGRRLFFDRRLSFNQTLSCGMCHIPEQGFTQRELATPVGMEGRPGRRNALSLYNVAHRLALFHDGREESLEQQVFAPLLATNELGNPSIGSVLQRLRRIASYVAGFQSAYGQGININTLSWALADYQRTLISADSPFDRWHFGGDADVVTASVKRGFTLFKDSGCAACHLIAKDHAHFTDDQFHDVGVARGGIQPIARLQVAPGRLIEVDSEVHASMTPAKLIDLGRFDATGQIEDRWKFRTPTLRNVALTAPYMHDGSLPTLRAVVDFFDRGGDHPDADERVQPLGLTESQKEDLIALLSSLTGSTVDQLAAD